MPVFGNAGNTRHVAGTHLETTIVATISDRSQPRATQLVVHWRKKKEGRQAGGSSSSSSMVIMIMSNNGHYHDAPGTTGAAMPNLSLCIGRPDSAAATIPPTHMTHRESAPSPLAAAAAASSVAAAAEAAGTQAPILLPAAAAAGFASSQDSVVGISAPLLPPARPQGRASYCYYEEQDQKPQITRAMAGNEQQQQQQQQQQRQRASGNLAQSRGLGALFAPSATTTTTAPNSPPSPQLFRHPIAASSSPAARSSAQGGTAGFPITPVEPSPAPTAPGSPLHREGDAEGGGGYEGGVGIGVGRWRASETSFGTTVAGFPPIHSDQQTATAAPAAGAAPWLSSPALSNLLKRETPESAPPAARAAAAAAATTNHPPSSPTTASSLSPALSPPFPPVLHPPLSPSPFHPLGFSTPRHPVAQHSPAPAGALSPPSHSHGNTSATSSSSAVAAAAAAILAAAGVSLPNPGAASSPAAAAAAAAAAPPPGVGGSAATPSAITPILPSIHASATTQQHRIQTNQNLLAPHSQPFSQEQYQLHALLSLAAAGLIPSSTAASLAHHPAPPPAPFTRTASHPAPFGAMSPTTSMAPAFGPPASAPPSFPHTLLSSPAAFFHPGVSTAGNTTFSPAGNTPPASNLVAAVAAVAAAIAAAGGNSRHVHAPVAGFSGAAFSPGAPNAGGGTGGGAGDGARDPIRQLLFPSGVTHAPESIVRMLMQQQQQQNKLLEQQQQQHPQYQLQQQVGSSSEQQQHGLTHTWEHGRGRWGATAEKRETSAREGEKRASRNQAEENAWRDSEDGRIGRKRVRNRSGQEGQQRAGSAMGSFGSGSGGTMGSGSYDLTPAKQEPLYSGAAGDDASGGGAAAGAAVGGGREGKRRAWCGTEPPDASISRSPGGGRTRRRFSLGTSAGANAGAGADPCGRTTAAAASPAVPATAAGATAGANMEGVDDDTDDDGDGGGRGASGGHAAQQHEWSESLPIWNPRMDTATMLDEAVNFIALLKKEVRRLHVERDELASRLPPDAKRPKVPAADDKLEADATKGKRKLDEDRSGAR
ncbi:unnamed protein product [Closterium sp. NIES-54]